jgi:hypothetical protein
MVDILDVEIKSNLPGRGTFQGSTAEFPGPGDFIYTQHFNFLGPVMGSSDPSLPYRIQSYTYFKIRRVPFQKSSPWEQSTKGPNSRQPYRILLCFPTS